MIAMGCVFDFSRGCKDMDTKRILFAPLATLCVGLAGLAPLPAHAADKPNILFILVDNLGYAEGEQP